MKWVYDGSHGLILIREDQKMIVRMPGKKSLLNIRKRHFEKNLILSNHYPSRLVQCMSIKHGTFAK